MRLSLAGKLVVLLVIASAVYFAWTRLVPPEMRARLPLPGQASRPETGATPAPPPEETPSPPAGGAPPPAPEATPSARPQGSPPETGAAADNEILFVTTAAKADWVQQEVERFNAAQGGKWRIMPRASPSREAMHDI